MEALNLFHQNFAVAESLIQLHQLFYGLKHAGIGDELRLAICRHWSIPNHSVVQHAGSTQVSVIARATTRIPESLTLDGGIDFLLRQAVVVACTCVESFFWDALRENVLTVVKARKSRADQSIKDIKLTLGDYVSIQQYDDPDLRLQQIILKNFERGTLYDTTSIDTISKILTVNNFWDQVEGKCGEKSATLKRLISDLIMRRNQVAHRADRPNDDEETDGHGLRPITAAWANIRIQAAKTLVSAGAEVIEAAIIKLQSDIQAAKEQEEARRLAERAKIQEAKEQEDAQRTAESTEIQSAKEPEGPQLTAEGAEIQSAKEPEEARSTAENTEVSSS